MLGNASTFAEFWSSGQGRILYRGSITFGSTTTFGSSEDVWGLRLPFPANRSSGVPDLPIGDVLLAQPTSDPALNMKSVTTLMDPFNPGGSQGMEDYYAHVFISHCIAAGTGAFTSGSSTCTVTHGMGLTPVVSDIILNPTNNPSTAPKCWWLSNFTSTTFDVNVQTASTTTPWAFSWKARAEPNTSTWALLVNHLRPWVWSAGHRISWQMEYEARR